MRFLYSSYSVKLPSKNSIYLHPGSPGCAWRYGRGTNGVRDNHRTARELQQGVFQRAQVSISRSLVGSSSSSMLPPTSAASPDADDRAHHRKVHQRVTLINPFKVKAANVGAAWHLGLPIFIISSPPETSSQTVLLYPLSHGTDQPMPVSPFHLK